ncbi:hypothetical protein BT96DRAFT_927268, partial [Gymnopus androsaceus JB14]
SPRRLASASASFFIPAALSLALNLAAFTVLTNVLQTTSLACSIPCPIALSNS